MTTADVARSVTSALLLAALVGACPLGDVRVPGSKDMGEECFDDEECDDPGTCLNGACSGYPCGEGGACKNELVCEQVNDQQSCVLPCDLEDRNPDCVGRQTCVAVARSVNNPSNTIAICL